MFKSCVYKIITVEEDNQKQVSSHGSGSNCLPACLRRQGNPAPVSGTVSDPVDKTKLFKIFFTSLFSYGFYISSFKRLVFRKHSCVKRLLEGLAHIDIGRWGADISTNIPHFTFLAKFYISRVIKVAELVGIRVRLTDSRWKPILYLTIDDKLTHVLKPVCNLIIWNVIIVISFHNFEAERMTKYINEPRW